MEGDVDDGNQDLRSFLKAHLATGRGELDWHPSSDVLEALGEGSLPPDEEQRVRSHLPLCPYCADLVLALGEFEGLDSPSSEEVPSEEVEAALDRLREEIRRQSPEDRPARTHGLHLLAAALGLAVAGLSLWSVLLYRGNRQLTEKTRSGGTAVSDLTAKLDEERRRSASLATRAEEQRLQIAELRRDRDEVLRPRINTPVLDLTPRSPRGASPALPIPEIPQGTDLFTLVLEPEVRRTFPTYRAEILDGSGQTLWTLDGLEKSDFGNFTLTLSRRNLPAGLLRIRIAGVRGLREERIGDYALQLSRD